VVEHVGLAASARDAAIGYLQGSPLRSDRGARPRRLEAVTELVADALAPRFRSRPIEGRIRALVITARR
jgi:hypothetical protein